MPSYNVLQPGFYNGRLYDPEGKRPVLTVDKAFKKNELPSWVEPMGKITVKKSKVDKETTVEDDRKEIEGASFMADGSQSPSVETL